MDEQEIGELLASADRPRQLTSEERLRGLRRLTERTTVSSTLLVTDDSSDVEAVSSDAEAVVLNLELSPTRNENLRLRRWVWAVAAALIVVVGVGVLSLVSSDTQSIDIADRDNIEVVPEGAFTGPCSGEFQRLIDGIEQWGDLESWAFAGSAEPDVSQLLASTFDAMGEVGVISRDVSDASVRLEAQLAEVDDGELPLLFSESVGKERVVEASIRELMLILRSQPEASGCDLERLDNALSS
ncbi:MAG: hypothetical protein R8J94_21800 [Acidimicrobiia bacterium]|nr:hypothetical protein [Acidimicrobiia bacterium]